MIAAQTRLPPPAPVPSTLTDQPAKFQITISYFNTLPMTTYLSDYRGMT